MAYDTLLINSPEEDEINKNATMNHVYHNKGWNFGMTQAHVEHQPIPWIKITYNGKLDKYFVKLKLCRYPTSSTLELFEFRMSFFDNGELEEFLLFVRNFNMTLAATWTLETSADIQHPPHLVQGAALCKFFSLSDYMDSTETLNVK